MSLNILMSKVLKKVGLNDVFLKCIYSIANIIYRKKSCLTYDKARKILEDYSPCPKSECFVDRRDYVNNEQYMVDIIVPCYNVEKTVKKCVESILNQKTDYKFRTIIVDDGSKDKTGEIVDMYNNYADVMVIHQENKGHSGARNTGLDILNSKYVMFVDSDDFIPEGTLDEMISKAEGNNAYLVQGSYCRVDAVGNIKEVVKTSSEIIKNIGDLYGFPWGKLYRSEIFKNLQFPMNFLFEDSIMRHIVFPMLIKNGNVIIGIDDNVYNYYDTNPINISNTCTKNARNIESFYITELLCRERNKYDLEYDSVYYDYILKMAVITYNRTFENDKKIQEALFVATRNFILSNFSDFKTQNKKYMLLEKAILKGNFKLYKIVVSLINV